MTTQTPDERAGWTSASNAEADSLCPGRFLAQRGLPEPPETPEASAGTIIHALWTGALAESEATFEEQDKALELASREREVAAQAGFGQECQRLTEQRLWHEFPALTDDPDMGTLRHSGRFDVVLFDAAAGRALVLDGKSGWLPTPPPNTNQQLRDLAVLVWLALGCNEVLVNILKPFGRQEPCCLYTETDLNHCVVEMEERVRRSNDPQSPRVAGESQCRYCRAAYWGKCPQHQAWLAAALPVVSPPLPMVSAAEWTPDQRSLFCERVSAAGKWLEARKDEIKALLKADPASVPGYGLRPGRTMETITQPQAVFERFLALGGKPEQFMAAVKIGKTLLKDQVRAVTVAKGKGLESKLDALLEGCTESKQSEPSIEKL